jgi:hypothetical protein
MPMPVLLIASIMQMQAAAPAPIPIIPSHFFGFDTIIYGVGAIICILIAYKASRLHAFSGKKQHFYLASAFTILGIALATITLTSAYTYYNMFYVRGGIYFFDQSFNVDDLGFWIYYISSFLAYGLLIMMYAPEDKGILAPAFLFSARYFEYFNIVLFFMMAYVAFRACTNFFIRKSRPALLVAAGFVMLAAYHAIVPFAMFDKLAYVLAYGSQLGGFASLLLMLHETGKK